MAKDSCWDTELYEAQHSFVWKMGQGLVATLAPQPGERILDLGCGTGQLTNTIAELGADVLGLDSSPEMIGQARQNYPSLRFLLEEASSMNFDGEFDAIFSNAALHWMPNAAAVAASMARSLRSGGRLVAELGGKGNIREIEEAVRAVLARYLGDVLPQNRTYFPALGEYAQLLEDHGFVVRSALLFDRPTPLEGNRGMERWIRQFAFYYFEPLRAEDRLRALSEAVEKLRPTRWIDGVWIADYVRLRVVAVKL